MSKRILVVDDSALVRKHLGELISGAGYTVEFAKNGQEAVDLATAEDYDAITMDINMPVKDGLSALAEILEQNPTPVLMVSSLTTEDAPSTIEALDIGAIDYVAKPGTMRVNVDENGDEILEKLEAVSRISKRRLARRLQNAFKPAPRREREKEEKAPVAKAGPAKSVLLIGSSTGGPNLIEEICASFPADYPHAVCIVQHMPEKFTAAFANRLDGVSALPVREHQHNEELQAGSVYVARGGTHMHFTKKVSGKIVMRDGKAEVKRYFTPSVDEMFFSALEVFSGNQMMAVELTGIGDDGADGMVAIKNAGGYTIAESEETATVYGMPKAAFERGGTCEVLPFPKIIQKIKTYR